MNRLTFYPTSDQEKHPITLIKSGLGIGGATLADVALLSCLRDRGHDVAVLTGFAAPSLDNFLEHHRIPARIDARLDQYTKEKPVNIKAAILGHLAVKGGVALYSQALCRAERNLGEAALDVSQQHPTVFRQHNHISSELETPFGESDKGAVVAVTDSMTQRFQSLNPNIPAYTLPPLIDARRFDIDQAGKQDMRREVRQSLGLAEEAVIIFQPTRVAPEKSVEYSLEVSRQLVQQLGRDVQLLIAGGNEPLSRCKEYKREMTERARKHNFKGLRFLEGQYSHVGTRRIADMMAASNLVILPSHSESFGLGVAEAALCKVPVLARRFKGDLSEPIFDEVYGEFDVVSDTAEATRPSTGVIDSLAEVLADEQRRSEMVERNHEQAQQYTITDSTYPYIYEVLSRADRR